jgi:hypothetical protein
LLVRERLVALVVLTGVAVFIASCGGSTGSLYSASPGRFARAIQTLTVAVKRYNDADSPKKIFTAAHPFILYARAAANLANAARTRLWRVNRVSPGR